MQPLSLKGIGQKERKRRREEGEDLRMLFDRQDLQTRVTSRPVPVSSQPSCVPSLSGGGRVKGLQPVEWTSASPPLWGCAGCPRAELRGEECGSGGEGETGAAVAAEQSRARPVDLLPPSHCCYVYCMLSLAPRLAVGKPRPIEKP